MHMFSRARRQEPFLLPFGHKKLSSSPFIIGIPKFTFLAVLTQKPTFSRLESKNRLFAASMQKLGLSLFQTGKRYFVNYLEHEKFDFLIQMAVKIFSGPIGEKIVFRSKYKKK